MNKTCDDCKWYVYTRMEIDDKGCRTNGYCAEKRAYNYHVSDKTDACPKFEHKQEQKQTVMVKCKDCKWYIAHDKNIVSSTSGDGQCCHNSAGYFVYYGLDGKFKSTLSFPLVLASYQCRKGKKKGENNED